MPKGSRYVDYFSAEDRIWPYTSHKAALSVLGSYNIRDACDKFQRVVSSNAGQHANRTKSLSQAKNEQARKCGLAGRASQ